MSEPDRDHLEAILESDVWRKPHARELTRHLVALTSPACLFRRAAYAVGLCWHALTRRKGIPRG